jgi:hypothetical protein
MRFAFPRSILVSSAAALTLLAACAQEAPPPPAPPPPPPPPPAISLAPGVIQDAAAYRGYMARAQGISPNFMDGLAIQQSLKVGEAYTPRQLVRGAIAYAAIVALQDPTFVASVRQFVDDPAQRVELANKIVAEPSYAAAFGGADRAAGLIEKALNRDTGRLFSAGAAVKQSAYDIQHQEWSKAFVPDRDARLSQAKLLSTQPIAGDISDVALLEQASLGAAPLGVSAGAAQPPYTPLVIHGLAVAALAALGQATEANSAQLDSLLADPTSDFCLNMAKLNLYQCLAVSKPHYEDVFCLGQHIMLDTAQCLMKGTGTPTPLTVATQPLVVPPVGAPVKILTPKTPKKTKASGAKSQ